MEEQTSRRVCFDRMRAIAVCGIILGAVSEVSAVSEAAGGQPLGFTWHLANFLLSLSRPCIPLLLMVLGAILLQKPTSDSPKSVWRYRILPLLISLAVWTAVYFVFRYLWQGLVDESVVPVEFIRELIHTPAAPHLWLMYLLPVLYLLLPLMRLLVTHAPRRLAIYTLGLWFFFSSLWPALSGLFPVLSLPAYNSMHMLGGYAGYLLLGWALATTEWRPSPRSMLILLGILWAATVVGTALLTKSAGEYNLLMHRHDMPNVVAMSAVLFMFCREFDRTTVFTPWLTPMAQFAFGMYFVYELYLYLLLPVIRSIPGVLSLLFAPALIWLLSLITVAFMRQSRITRRLFLGNL